MALAQENVLYTADAAIVCAACNDKADVLATDMRAANNIRRAAYAALALAVFSFFFNLLFCMTATSTISAIFALRSFGGRQDDRFTKHIARSKVLIMTAAILALVINAVVVLFGVLISMAVMSNLHHRGF